MGGKLDGTSKDEFRQRMKVYFERMKRLTENVSLESRIRFMVQVCVPLAHKLLCWHAIMGRHFLTMQLFSLAFSFPIWFA